MEDLDPKLTEKIKKNQHRYDEILSSLADPTIIANQTLYQKYSKELAEVEPIVEAGQRYDGLFSEYLETKDMLEADPDWETKSLIKEELNVLEDQLEAVSVQLQELLTPQDPNDQRSVIIEIRAGAGGEEAALFCGVLFRMYSEYAITKGWKTDYIDSNETELGGFKEIIFSIEGKGAYRHFKYESGVHRVQRVPVTESSGRVHTSTVTVAVLPEVDQVEFNLNPNDLRIDTFRASGAGGQHVNRTESAIRITHLPTGVVVQCQDQRSQYKNKDKAMAVLVSRLTEMENAKFTGDIASNRKNQVGTGDRSERIRTYNYHQGRVTDHRIGLTLYQLEDILNGDLEDVIRALLAADQKYLSEYKGEEDD